MSSREKQKHLARRLRERMRREEGEGGPASPPLPDAPAGPAARLAALRAASLSLPPSALPDSPSAFLMPPPLLTDLLPGEILERAEGTFYRVRRTAADLCGDARELVRRYGSLFACPNLHGEFAPLRRTTPERVLFLDIETTGLMATPLFLIGLASLVGGEMVMTQLLARDYAEEAAILADFREWLARHEALVTFNGKSFDVRYLGDRLVYHRLPADIPHPHVDLLLPARQRWRGRWENCRLQTLENRVCGRTRTGDIASAEIPQVYHAFVRTGDARLLEPILYHNAMDLVTMVELLVALVEPLFRPPLLLPLSDGVEPG